MSKQFQDKVVFITGASSGFGIETARLFAQEGSRLVLLARRKDRLEALKEELYRQYETDSFILTCDVTQEEQVVQQINQLPLPFHTPHILINNAGLSRGLAKLWEISSKEWDEMIDTNIKGVLNITRHILPNMLKANRGHVINVGSVSGHDVYPGGGVYCATKYAVRALTNTLREELVATPIRVSLISPGMAQTEFSTVRFEGDQKRADQVYQGMKPLTAQDIAETILFIASRPAHVNIGDIIIYPKDQASTTIVHRS